MDLRPNYGLSNTKEEEKEVAEVLNALPRTVLRSNAYVLLNGEWKFALDLEDKGLSEDWQAGHIYSDFANWPGSIESHMANAKSGATSWTDKVVAWYERDFPLPERANGENTSSMLQLSIGACAYKTRVWLNGIPLKTIEGLSEHVGQFTSFSYELDEEILQPINRLTVRIEDDKDADSTRGKQESHVYKRGGIWYQTYSGPVRDIWLETVERNRLRSRIGVVSIVEDNLVRFTVTLRIHDPGEYIIRLSIREKKGTEVIATSDFPIHLEAGQHNQRLVVAIPGARHWSHTDPNLYLLHADLVDSAGLTASIETFFGLRKIEARGCCIYLNNKKVYLDGILYQPGIATYESIKKHMYAMKDLGCNLVRIHIAGVDPRIYNLADKLGMMLWLEVPSPHRSTVQSRKNHREELLRMLNMIEAHPSVVIWTLYNEDWGAQDIATNQETRQYVIDTYHYMHITHPQFLVVDNDGWQHVSFEGRLKSDLLTAHLYTPDIERWKVQLDKLVKGDNEGVAAFPLVVGDPFFYRQQVPLLVSEWGGFGFVDYGGPMDPAGRTQQIKLFKQEIRNRAIAGDVYTQATNIEDEVNGLIDAETGALHVEAGVLRSTEK